MKKHYILKLIYSVPLLVVSPLAIGSIVSNHNNIETKSGNKNANVNMKKDQYKYIKGTSKLYHHDDYTYYLGIGTKDLNYWIGQSWDCIYNPDSYHHNATEALHPWNNDPNGDYPWEYYFNSAGAYHWSSFSPSSKKHMFPSDFDSDMAGWESRDFSGYNSMEEWGDSNFFVQAWQKKVAIIMIYITSYTDTLHLHGVVIDSELFVATQADYNHYFG